MKNREVQERIIVILLRNKEKLKKFIEMAVSSTYFTNLTCFYIVREIIDYYLSYEGLLSFDILLERLMIRKDVTDEDINNIKAFFAQKDKIEVEDEEFDYLVSDRLIDYGVSMQVKHIVDEYIPLINACQGRKAAMGLLDSLTNMEMWNDKSKMKEMDFYSNWQEQYQDIYNRQKYPDKYAGLKTGLAGLDKNMSLQRGSEAMIVGYTQSGKTTLSDNIIHNQSEIFGYNVVVFTLEMSNIQWSKKNNAKDLGYDYDYLLGKKILTEEHLNLIYQALEARAKKPRNNFYKIIQPQGSALDLRDIDRKIKEYSTIFKPDVVCIDYLDLLKPLERHPAQIYMEVREKAQEFRHIAKKYNFLGWMIHRVSSGAIKYSRNGQKREIIIELDNTAGSKDLVYDVDIFMALINDPDDMSFSNLIVKKDREGMIEYNIPLNWIREKCIIQGIDNDFVVEDGVTPVSNPDGEIILDNPAPIPQETPGEGNISLEPIREEDINLEEIPEDMDFSTE